MMIRFAIFLRCQSPRAYESLRESGVLKLPNQATLRDYTNFIQPHSGFQAEAFQVILSKFITCMWNKGYQNISLKCKFKTIWLKELKKIADNLPPEKKYVCLLHDEMKIKADLVYDRRSQQVIGFTNPETWSFDEVKKSLITKCLQNIMIHTCICVNTYTR